MTTEEKYMMLTPENKRLVNQKIKELLATQAR